MSSTRSDEVTVTDASQEVFNGCSRPTETMIGSGGVPDHLADSWRAFIADLEEMADEYRDRGYSVVEIHPGDVVPLDDRVALDVLAPGSEFEALQELVDTDFDPTNFSVYRATEGPMTFAVVVAEDEENEQAVCVAVFYHLGRAEAFLANAERAGFFQVQVRPLSDDDHVVFKIEDPTLLFD